MNITNEQLRNIIAEELAAVLAEESSDPEEIELTDPCEMAKDPTRRPMGMSQQKAQELCAAQSQVEEAAKKPPCDNTLSRKKWKCKGAKSQK